MVLSHRLCQCLITSIFYDSSIVLEYFRNMANEKKTDILIARLLREAGIDAEPNGSRIKV